MITNIHFFRILILFSLFFGLYFYGLFLVNIYKEFTNNHQRKQRNEIDEKKLHPRDDWPISQTEDQEKNDLLDLGMYALTTSSPIPNKDKEDIETSITNYTDIEDLNSIANGHLGLKKRCPFMPPNFYSVEKDLFFSEASDCLMKVKAGGVHQITECKARQSAAVVIPYGGQKNVLETLLYFLHPFLMKQQLDYQVFVVEDVRIPKKFNLGQLYNAGVAEALKCHPWKCLIFNEAHFLPLDRRNLYRCHAFPRQLFNGWGPVGSDRRPHKLEGVMSITPEAFRDVDGFSNKDLGNEEHYAEFKRRLLKSNYVIEKVDPTVGVFRIVKPRLSIIGAIDGFSSYKNRTSELSMSIETNDWHANRTTMRDTFSDIKDADGLSSKSYEVKSILRTRYYTHVKIVRANGFDIQKKVAAKK